MKDDHIVDTNKNAIIKERMKAGIIENGENINEVIGKIEQLTETIDNTLQLVDQKGELLFECELGDKYHQLILEVGLNKILEDSLKERIY